MRLEATPACDHGEYDPHLLVFGKKREQDVWCEGGDRRVASTADLIEELKARGAIDYKAASKVISKRQGSRIPTWYEDYAKEVVDAALRFVDVSLEGEK